MNTYSLKPLKSVGAIVFSADRAEIRATLGEYTEFKKNKFSKNTTDDFGFCQVFYDVENHCEAVEFGKDNAIIICDGVILTELSFLKAKEYLSAIDVAVEVTSDSVTSKKLGISFYAPNGEVENLLFFRDRYFG